MIKELIKKLFNEKKESELINLSDLEKEIKRGLNKDKKNKKDMNKWAREYEKNVIKVGKSR